MRGRLRKEPWLALFGKKKTEETPKPAAGGTPNGAGGGTSGGSGGKGAGGDGAAGTPGGGSGKMEFSPEKARRFFEHARTVSDATNYEYALTLWLNGLRQDPSNLEALQSFFQSAQAFLGTGAKGVSRDTMNQFTGGKGDLDRYLHLLLNTATRRTEGGLAVRAAEAAAKLGLWPAAIWLGDRAYAIAAAEKRPRKEHFVDLMQVFRTVEAFDRAVKAGEAGTRIDPLDGKLAGEVRNLSAESTMTRGGYEQSGREGAFRANIKDAEQQKRLEEEERLVRTDETMDRMVERARTEYEANPGDRTMIRNYARRLLERRRGDDEEKAIAVLERAHRETQEFGFRAEAGDIRLKLLKKELAALKDAAEKGGPDDTGAQEAYEAAKREMTEAELHEMQARVEAYPSDRVFKFELGKRLFEAGRYEESISLLQAAKDEPKQRIRVLGYLGQAFLAIQFFDGAIETFRAALESVGSVEGDMGMELRYGLMVALQGKAEESDDIGCAEEADKLASSIAIQNFSYRDIKQKRQDLKQLVGRLKRGDAAPPPTA